MSDEQDKLKLSLEPPKLFGRKKKSGAAPATPATPAAPAARPTPPEAAEEPAEERTVEEPAVEEPAVEKPAVAEPAAEEPAAEEPAAEEPAAEEPAAETVVADEPMDESDAEQTVVLDEPEPEPEPEPSAVAAPASTPVSKPKRTPTPAQAPAPRPVKVEVVPEPVTDAAREDAEIVALAASGSLLSAYRAAALTGLVVGAAMVVLTWLSLRGCEAIRGTASCGGGPGFLLLVATFALCVLLGAQLLKAFAIPDPGSSSFLAVGLVAVVSLLFLIDFLDHWSTLILVPLLSIAAHLASVWVTKTFVDSPDD